MNCITYSLTQYHSCLQHRLTFYKQWPHQQSTNLNPPVFQINILINYMDTNFPIIIQEI